MPWGIFFSRSLTLREFFRVTLGCLLGSPKSLLGPPEAVLGSLLSPGVCFGVCFEVLWGPFVPLGSSLTPPLSPQAEGAEPGAEPAAGAGPEEEEEGPDKGPKAEEGDKEGGAKVSTHAPQLATPHKAPPPTTDS